jgi:hypothetical protein
VGGVQGHQTLRRGQRPNGDNTVHKRTVTHTLNLSHCRAARTTTSENNRFELKRPHFLEGEVRDAQITRVEEHWWVTVRLYCPWKTTMTSGQDVSEYLDTLGLVKSYFSSFLRKKNFKKIGRKNVLVLRQTQRIRRFACLQDFLLTLTCHLAIYHIHIITLVCFWT